MEYISNNAELAFMNRERALEVANKLLEEDYVIMLSKEENLTIINFIWETNANRNNIVFQDRGIVEDQIFGRD